MRTKPKKKKKIQDSFILVMFSDCCQMLTNTKLRLILKEEVACVSYFQLNTTKWTSQKLLIISQISTPSRWRAETWEQFLRYSLMLQVLWHTETVLSCKIILGIENSNRIKKYLSLLYIFWLKSTGRGGRSSFSPYWW